MIIARHHYARIVVAIGTSLLATIALATNAHAGVTKPSDTGLPFGGAGSMPAMPGPPLNMVTGSTYFPMTDPGSGYSVYVCKAADDVGYTSGDLNEAFDYSTNLDDTVNNNGQGAEYSSSVYEHSSLADAVQWWHASDTCNNWKSGTMGRLFLRIRPGHDFIQPDNDSSDGSRGRMVQSFNFRVGGNLSIARMSYDLEVASYKTATNLGQTPNNVVGSYIGMSAGSRGIPDSGLGNSGGHEPVDDTSVPIRVCAHVGRYDVNPPSQSGAYSAGTWLDGNYRYAEAEGIGWMLHRLGAVWSNPYYSFGTPTQWHPYMRSTFTPSNFPDAVCRIADGDSNTFFRTAYETDSISLFTRCGPFADDSFWGCRGTVGGINDEAPITAANDDYAFVSLKTMRIFIHDATDPTVTIAPGGMNAGGATIGSGNTNTIQEQLNWSLSDDSGIRRVRVRVGGPIAATLADRSYICDHRYRVPCPWGTGTSSSFRPPAPSGGPMDQLLWDIDPLPRGLYTLYVDVWDGAGNVITRTAQFRNNTARPVDNCGMGAAAPGAAPLTPTTRTGVYGTDVVDVPAQTCDGSPFADPVPTTPTDLPNTPGALVGLPGPGSSVFSYELAANQRPTSSPLNPAECVMLNHVVNGSGASGDLSPRERNQIVSITIDLRSFVKGVSSTGTLAGQLGEQSLKTTFDLPTRATSGYRTALGCP